MPQSPLKSGHAATPSTKIQCTSRPFGHTMATPASLNSGTTTRSHDHEAISHSQSHVRGVSGTPRGSRLHARSASLATSRDHPRVRGEQRVYGGGVSDAKGPSPYARGAVIRLACHLRASGTIPARGEQWNGSSSPFAWMGPSPRARGAARPTARSASPAGTIPVCAGSRSGCGRTSPTRWDHPRVRGEQFGARAGRFRRSGPSPRARGADRPPRLARGADGTIPACAGSRSCLIRTRPSPRDYPRVRGEQCCLTAPAPPEWGPSPRARGAVTTRGKTDDRPGTIPACAGSSVWRCGPARACRDHPRVRGEQVWASPPPHWQAGPSPRARGAAHHHPGLTVAIGTIPACAGSSTCPATSPRRSWDHPRVRGEQRAIEDVALPQEGPSPRARGAASAGPHRAGSPGTIPACAGSSTPPPAPPWTPWDHPRVRGEQRVPSRFRERVQGPSPRARGAVDLRDRADLGDGTIPACAGSSPASRPPRARAGDHPRVRGEQDGRGVPVSGGTGPSPRARGAGVLHWALADVPGTIPACAGSSSVAGSRGGDGWDHPRVRGEQFLARDHDPTGPGPSPRARGADSLNWAFLRLKARNRALLKIRTSRTWMPSRK